MNRSDRITIGYTPSLVRGAHGKSLSYVMLGIELPGMGDGS
jgi:hypothetical protein